jgi:hypothetical protein
LSTWSLLAVAAEELLLLETVVLAEAGLVA